MPFTYGFIGWVTNVLALRMTFYPLKFVGIPPYLGWQGIVPRKAPNLALKSIKIMTEKLIRLEEFFAKVDPELMEKDFQPIVDAMIPQICDELLHEVFPSQMDTLKEQEDLIIAEVKLRSSHAVKEISQKIKENPSGVFNFRSLVLRKLTGPNVEQIVEIFEEVGSKEFSFIEKSGFVFGAILGGMQALLWLVYPQWWTLPLQGVFVGFITNWLALTMIFRPLNEKRFGFFAYQGLFLKRQEEVSKKYSQLFATKILTGSNVMEEVLYKRVARKLIETILKVSGEILKETPAEGREFKELQEEVVESLKKASNQLEKYMERAMSIEKNMFSRMKALPPEEFEPILRSAFQEDEYILILIGSVLGAVTGGLQAVYMLYFS